MSRLHLATALACLIWMPACGSEDIENNNASGTPVVDGQADPGADVVTGVEPDVSEPDPDVSEPDPDVSEPDPDVSEPEPDVSEPDSGSEPGDAGPDEDADVTEPVNPCDPNPCLNGGECSVVDVNAAECACSEGFSGDLCEDADPKCGDGNTDPGEVCDDGNFDNADGCLDTCAEPSCGDGFINGSEVCDDSLATPTTLRGGHGGMCMTRASGRALCWDYEDIPLPLQGSFLQMGHGVSFFCGLRPNGTIDCATEEGEEDWGKELTDAPQGVFTELKTSTYNSCAKREDGSLSCWGFGSAIQDVPDGAFTDFTVGGYRACGRLENEELVCWGDDVGEGAEPPPGDYLQVVLGYGQNHPFACAILPSNEINCWAELSAWSEGNNEATVLEVPSGADFVKLVTSYTSACALRSNGQIVCWGDATEVSQTPTNTTFTDIGLGYGVGCGQLEDGSLECWRSTPDAYSPQPTCDSDCTEPECGDGLVNTWVGEECDPGEVTPTCDANCKVTEDPCDDVDCGDYGACVDGACVCTDGYSGDACDVPPVVDPCEGVDCGDYGACVDGACVCTDGYSGDTCDVPPVVDPCEDVDCGDYGACVDGACVCTDGYSGDACDVPPVVDPCEGVDCGDYGACVDGACVCTNGYSGDACDVPPVVDPCEDVDCGVHGECIEGTCNCEAGWTGELCTDEEAPPESFVAVCDLSDVYGYCLGYIGAFYTEDYVGLTCAQGVVQEACPTDDLVIKCRENEGTEPDLETLMYYYTSMYEVEGLGVANEQDAIDNCEAKGGTVE